MNRICVYCGSSMGKNPKYRLAARALGKELVANNIALVYGGASVGLMGEIADSVLLEGGEVTGVIPQSLVDKEVSHQHLSHLKVVGSMHERKALMVDMSDGFIALPGGLGTLEELFEVLTWAQLGFHQKPCALLNSAGYYNELQTFLNHGVDEQFVKPIHRDMLLVESEPKELLAAMIEYNAPLGDKWIS